MKRNTAPLVAIAIGALIFTGARVPYSSGNAPADAGKHLAFSRVLLPNAPFTYKSSKDFRYEINPHLIKIAPWVSLIGVSAAFVDHDGDGLSNDLCLTDPRSKTASVIPAPGTGVRFGRLELVRRGIDFKNVGEYPSSCESGDFNRNGMIDYVVTFLGRTPVVILDPVQDRDSAVRISLPPLGPDDHYGSATVVADVDGDGYQDIVAGNYWKEGEQVYNPKSNHVPALQNGLAHADNGGLNLIYLRRPDWPGVAFEATQPFPESESRAYTLANAAADLNGDGLPELYYSNDFGPDHLYLNRSKPGRLSFERIQDKRNFFIPKSKVMGMDSFKGMGVDFADLNGDGTFDIFVSNIAGEWKVQESHFLWLSERDGKNLGKERIYREASEELGLSRSDWGWDSKLADLDLDGRLEALQAVGAFKGEYNGWPEVQQWAMGLDPLIADPKYWPDFRNLDVSGNARNRLYYREPEGRFINVGDNIGFSGSYCTRGIAFGDVDGDGDLDIATANLWEDSHYFKNESARRGNFIGLHVLMAAHHRGTGVSLEPGHTKPEGFYHALGATVRLIQAGNPGARFLVDGGNGHGGSRSPDVVMGIHSEAQGPFEVEIEWRDASGQFNSSRVSVPLGWHTVILGESKSGHATHTHTAKEGDHG
jgi:hypothetical protein